MNFIEYWREFVVAVGLISAYFGGRKSKVIQERKDNALATQEEIKIKKEDVSLSQMIQETYQRLNKDVFTRLEGLEKSNDDLTKKYDEILLRNGILEEKSEAYEKKYETLKKDYVKLKLDYDKVHKENKEIRVELDELKNSAI